MLPYCGTIIHYLQEMTLPIEGFPLLNAAVSLELHRALAGAALPMPSGLPNDSIARAARNMRPPGVLAPDWVLSIVGILGGAVRTLEDEWPDAPLLAADAPGRFLISLPSGPILASRGRDWFVAIALAHMRLHWPPKSGWGAQARLLYVPRSLKGDAMVARNEAMSFAVEMLMPQDEFIAAMSDPDSAAETLGIQVSEGILKARARSLGMEL